jgi:hypothetical protein
MTMMGWLGVREPLFDEWGNSQILRRPQDDNDGVYALDDAPPFLSSFGGLRITMMWCMPGDDAPLFTVIPRSPQDDKVVVYTWG